jgi:hypothetical protein
VADDPAYGSTGADGVVGVSSTGAGRLGAVSAICEPRTDRTTCVSVIASTRKPSIVPPTSIRTWVARFFSNTTA